MKQSNVGAAEQSHASATPQQTDTGASGSADRAGRNPLAAICEPHDGGRTTATAE
jgi:hypothetical protein